MPGSWLHPSRPGALASRLMAQPRARAPAGCACVPPGDRRRLNGRPPAASRSAPCEPPPQAAPAPPSGGRARWRGRGGRHWSRPDAGSRTACRTAPAAARPPPAATPRTPRTRAARNPPGKARLQLRAPSRRTRCFGRQAGPPAPPPHARCLWHRKTARSPRRCPPHLPRSRAGPAHVDAGDAAGGATRRGRPPRRHRATARPPRRRVRSGAAGARGRRAAPAPCAARAGCVRRRVAGSGSPAG